MSDKPLSRQRQYQLKYQKLGLCIICKQPLNLYKVYCDQHAAIHRERMRKVSRIKVGIPIGAPVSKRGKPRLDKE